MSSKITLSCGFLLDSIGPAEFVDLIEGTNFGFSPYSIQADSQKMRFTANSLQKIRPMKSRRLKIWGVNEDGTWSGYVLLITVSGSRYQQLIVVGNGSSSEFLERVCSMAGFISALTYDGRDVVLQSAENPSDFNSYGLPWRHLPHTIGPGGDVKIDVTGNVGRMAYLAPMQLCAGASMWFGSPSFGVIDRDRLLSCPVGRVSVSGEVVRVDLFGLDDDVELIRERQRLFREWMDYDGIEERFRDVPVDDEGPGDAHVEFLFEDRVDGRPRRYVEWLRDGRPVRRSEATEVFEVVFGDFGESLRRGIRKVTDQDLL